MSSKPSSAHRFRVGQKVRLLPGLRNAELADGEYEVVRLLPAEGKDLQYRVRDIRERIERVVRESEIA